MEKKINIEFILVVLAGAHNDGKVIDIKFIYGRRQAGPQFFSSILIKIVFIQYWKWSPGIINRC